MRAEIGQPYCRDCGALMEPQKDYGPLSYTCTECGKHQINPYLKQPEKNNIIHQQHKPRSAQHENK